MQQPVGEKPIGSAAYETIKLFILDHKSYFSRKQLFIVVMGVSSGLPILLTLSTLTFWLSKAGVDRSSIGLFTLVGLPYTMKWVWATLFDRYKVPFSRFDISSRKGWIIFFQIATAVTILLLGATDPKTDPYSCALVVLLMAFCSASLDINVDAYRIQTLNIDDQGKGAASTQFGYRVGMLLSGAGVLALSDFVSWPTIFLMLSAILVLLGILTAFAPDYSTDQQIAIRDTRDPKSVGSWVGVKLAEFIPLWGQISFAHLVIILLFILLYRVGDSMGAVMANPFYVEFGYTGTEIAVVTKLWGVWLTIVGAIIGGVIVSRYGIYWALLFGGILQASTNLGFVLISLAGKNSLLLVATITLDSFAGGLAGAALVGFLSSLCNVQFAATHYAILTSIMAQGRTLFSSLSGFLVDYVGWFNFWISTIVLAVPALFLLIWVQRIITTPDSEQKNPGIEL